MRPAGVRSQATSLSMLLASSECRKPPTGFWDAASAVQATSSLARSHSNFQYCDVPRSLMYKSKERHMYPSLP